MAMGKGSGTPLVMSTRNSACSGAPRPATATTHKIASAAKRRAKGEYLHGPKPTR